MPRPCSACSLSEAKGSETALGSNPFPWSLTVSQTPFPRSHRQRTSTNLLGSIALPWTTALFRASRMASSTANSLPTTQRHASMSRINCSTIGEINPISLGIHPSSSSNKELRCTPANAGCQVLPSFEERDVLMEDHPHQLRASHKP